MSPGGDGPQAGGGQATKDAVSHSQPTNMEEGENFPADLTNKYTVSKVLGRGAHGEVRLGFR